MKVNRTGITRIVFVFKNVVVKIPNFSYSWRHFLQGLIANINENRAWKWNSGKYETGQSHLLCPVIWCSWGGWILIMAKADMSKWEKEVMAMPPIENTDCEKIKESNNQLYKQWIDFGFGGDDKCDNYGYYQNKLVKVDYGN